MEIHYMHLYTSIIIYFPKSENNNKNNVKLWSIRITLMIVKEKIEEDPKIYNLRIPKKKYIRSLVQRTVNYKVCLSVWCLSRRKFLPNMHCSEYLEETFRVDSGDESKHFLAINFLEKLVFIKNIKTKQNHNHN